MLDQSAVEVPRASSAEPLRLGFAAGVLLAVGATLGTVFDGFHTFSGVTWYAAPVFLRAAWWVPPLFAFAAMGVGLGRVMIGRAVRERPAPRPSWNAVVVAMTVFALGYAASGFLPVSAATKAGLLFAGFAGLWLAIDRTPAALLHAVGCGISGWAVERVMVGHGLFSHRDTQLDGVALWIPSLYALASVAIGALARRLSRHHMAEPQRLPTPPRRSLASESHRAP